MTSTAPESMASPACLIGTTFAHRYAIEAQIAETEGAEVFTALDLESCPPQRIVLKVCRSSDEPEACASFDHEAAILQKINAHTHHLAVVELLHSVGGRRSAFGALRPKPLVEHLGLRGAFGALRPKPLVEHLGLRGAFGALRPKPHVHYLVLEHIDGPTLRQEMLHGELAPDRIRSIGLAIARTLSALHARRIGHGDLKPENVVLQGKLDPVLIDFGSAIDESLEEADDVGPYRRHTPAYAAPEQRRGEGASLSSDIYAWALLMCELWCGEPGRPPAEALRDMPSAMNRVVTAALSTDPLARPPAAQIVLQLENAPVAKLSRRFWIGATAAAAIGGISGWFGLTKHRNRRGWTVPLVGGAWYLARTETHLFASNAHGGKLYRMSFDGTGVELIFAHSQRVEALAASGRFVYFRNGSEVWAGDTDGRFSRVAEGAGSGNIVADQDGVFFANPTTGTIEGLGPSGVPPLRVLAREQPAPMRMTLDETHIYWTNWTSDVHARGNIARVARTGGVVEVLTQAPLRATDLALDGEYLYWIDALAGGIWRIARSGGSAKLVCSTQPGGSAMCVQRRYVYFANEEQRMIARVLTTGGVPEIRVTGRFEPTALLNLPGGIVVATRHARGGVEGLVLD